MNALDFACVLHEITKKLKIDMDSDLAAKMFDFYEGTYQNYTLLELIGLLQEHKIPITCPWNKIDIINMIETNRLPVPKKYESMEPTKWEFFRVRKSLDVIQTRYMEFSEDNMIQMASGTIYIVNTWITEEQMSEDDPYSWEQVAYLMLKNTETHEEYQVEPYDFFDALDNDDITIIQDTNRKYYANEEMKQKWENYIRWL